MGVDGRVVGEKEWRRQNLDWERRRRDAVEEEARRAGREQEQRRHRAELRQVKPTTPRYSLCAMVYTVYRRPGPRSSSGAPWRRDGGGSGSR